MPAASSEVHGITPAMLQGQPPTPENVRALLARTRHLGEGAQFRSDWVPGDPSLTFGLRVPGDSADMPVQ